MKKKRHAIKLKKKQNKRNPIRWTTFKFMQI